MTRSPSAMNQDLDAYLLSREGELVSLLRDLVAIPTENPPGAAYDRCTGFLMETLRRSGLTARRHRVPDAVCREVLSDSGDYPRYNVVGRWDTGADETVHFNGHYDVVPAGDGWRFGAFNPREENGWLYGRGTSDMKGSLAAVCFAVTAIKAFGIQPACNLELSFTADEETDSRLGIGHLLRAGLIDPEYAVVCEGGGGTRVCCGHNGVLWYDVIVHGKSAHGSRPELGINAFEKMARLVAEMEGYKSKIGKRHFQNLDGACIHPTLTIGGRFEGSREGKVNSIPGRAAFTLDRRVLPNECVEDARRELEEWIRHASRHLHPARLELRCRSAYQPCFVDAAHPLPERFRRAAASVLGKPVSNKTSLGFNDMHFFAEQGIPVIGYGAQGENDHGVDERLSLSELMTTARVYAHFMAGWGTK